jgi:hypothetical protein
MEKLLHYQMKDQSVITGVPGVYHNWADFGDNTGGKVQVDLK